MADQSARIVFEDVKTQPHPAAAAAQVTTLAQPNWSQQPTSAYTQHGAVEYAGFLRRWGAIILDGFVVGIGSFIIGIGLAILIAIGGGLESESDTDAWSGLFWLMGLVVQWLYYAFLESSPWQATLGKRAVGIVVTDESGNRLSFGRATGRYWAKFFSYVTLLIGFAMAGFTPKKQALHDMVANTLVVVGKKS